MNNSKVIWSAVVVVAIIAIIGLYVPNASAPVVVDSSLGATPLSTNYTAIGLGTNDRYVISTGVRQNTTSATTTPCSILSPSATSSLAFADINITTPTSTATTWTLATSTNAFATTSLTMTAGLGASAQGSLIWDGGSNNSLVAPSTWVNWGVASAGSGNGVIITGTCQAVFTIVS